MERLVTWCALVALVMMLFGLWLLARDGFVPETWG